MIHVYKTYLCTNCWEQNLKFWPLSKFRGSESENLALLWKSLLFLEFSSDFRKTSHKWRTSQEGKNVGNRILNFCLCQILRIGLYEGITWDDIQNFEFPYLSAYISQTKHRNCAIFDLVSLVTSPYLNIKTDLKICISLFFENFFNVG